MRTKEEILKSYNALAHEVMALNESTTDNKERFHMFFIGGHITEKNGDEYLVGHSQLLGADCILGKLSANDDAVKNYLKITKLSHISKLLENLGGNKND